MTLNIQIAGGKSIFKLILGDSEADTTSKNGYQYYGYNNALQLD
jgi:hypothetical protein